MPTEKEIELCADILADPERAQETAEEVASRVLLAVEGFRKSAYRYSVVARYGTDYYVSYPCKTKPEAVQVARQLIAEHQLDRIAILPVGDPLKAPPGSTADWVWISAPDMERMHKEK